MKTNYRMGFINRLKTGITLTVDSLRVMRNNPRLFLFPLVSGVAGLAFLVVFLGMTFGLMAIDPEGGALVGLAVVYFGLTFISSFFTAALVHQTRDAIVEDSQPSVRDGISGAWEVKRPLLIWSAIAATIGVIINALENSDSRAARLFGTIFGIAWTLMTFFIIPIIVFEKVGVKEMFTKSAGTFKDLWGETPISLIGVTLVSMVVVIPFVVVGIAVVQVSTILGIGIIFAGVLGGFLVSQTLQGVIKTTLYLYATEGFRPAEFDNVDFDDLAKADGTARGTGPSSGGRGGFV